MSKLNPYPPAGADAATRDVAGAHEPLPWKHWLAWLIVLVVAADFASFMIRNPTFEWPVVAHWLSAKSILSGLGVTLGLTAISMIIGVLLGLGLAIARLSDSKLARWLAGLYIWFFRGTPLLVQLIFWYNLSTLFPQLSLSIPLGPTFGPWSTNELITPLTAAIAGLALNEAAYMAEIIRAGLLSVDSRQRETALAFGMTRGHALRRIVIPQAMRSIVPPTGNQLISMIKATSLVSVIAMGDLLYAAQNVYNRTFEVVPLLTVAVIWYLLVTSVLNFAQSAIEKHYARGDGRKVARKRESTSSARGGNMAASIGDGR
ncbi:amino acid ABC transporter permease [Burkholderia sp. Bp9131]|uniref:amino acid ABC transporter permease n=1 Tax=Burkholderia sp. Bp9131 TaxID=2184571 RepID=UPI000F584CAF|nr:amino acid ABC transporter permease [Burkholderia sp. Bp9131]RQR43465.1 amino acid ABC transporter permease [Burkholderia sp. Bp9131]